LNWGIPLVSGKLKGPGLNWKIKPYANYSKKDGWSFGIDIKNNQTRKGAGWAVPFNSGTAEQIYGLNTHPDLYDITSERTRGLQTISTMRNWDGTITPKTYFDLKFGTSVHLLLIGTGVNFGIKEL
jgi:hypothetical protein